MFYINKKYTNLLNSPRKASIVTFEDSQLHTTIFFNCLAHRVIIHSIQCKFKHLFQKSYKIFDIFIQIAK